MDQYLNLKDIPKAGLDKIEQTILDARAAAAIGNIREATLKLASAIELVRAELSKKTADVPHGYVYCAPERVVTSDEEPYSGILNAAHLRSQRILNEQAYGMMNALASPSKDAGIRSGVSVIKGLVEDIVMSERRVYRSNQAIVSGSGESVYLTQKRVQVMKELDSLIHLTGSERIAEFRQDVLKLLDVLERRRDRASQYVHGQLYMHVIIEYERRVDRLRQRIRDFVAHEFGATPTPQPRVGILRRVFTRKAKDPTEWYLNYTAYPARG